MLPRCSKATTPLHRNKHTVSCTQWAPLPPITHLGPLPELHGDSSCCHPPIPWGHSRVSWWAVPFQTVFGRAQDCTVQGEESCMAFWAHGKAPLRGEKKKTWGEITISTSSSRQLEKQQGLETSPGGESQAGPGTMSRWHRHLPVQRVLNAGSPRISSMLVFGVVESKHCQTSRCLKQHQASAVSQKIHTLHAHCC